jgi:hypothetical protein
MAFPVFTKLESRPGWGKSTTSGGLPPLMRMEMEASNSLEPSYWMSMPVRVSNSRTDSLNFTASLSVKGPDMVTTVPLSLPA